MNEKAMYIFYPTNKKNLTYFVNTKLHLSKEITILNFPPEEDFLDKRQDFMKAFDNKSNNYIIMSWLGSSIQSKNYTNSCLEIVLALSEDDWVAIKGSTNTILVGYSDITILHCEMLNHGICSIYGPNFYPFLKSNDKEMRYMLQSIYKIFNKRDFCINLRKGKKEQTINPGVGTGRLIGGNLHTLFDLQRTKPEYMVKRQRNDLIFLEDVETYYKKRENDISSLQAYRYKYLSEHGFFDDISGLIIGRTKYPHVQYGNQAVRYATEDEERICIKDILQSLDIDKIPVIVNIACSHIFPMLSLPLGRICTLDSEKCILKVH